MAIGVVSINVVVVVLPIFGAGVIGRVDVDGIDFALVRVEESLENVVVLCIDDRVEGLVSPALDFAGGPQSRVDRVSELCDDNEILDCASGIDDFVFRDQRYQVSAPTFIRSLDTDDAP